MFNEDRITCLENDIRELRKQYFELFAVVFSHVQITKTPDKIEHRK